MKEAQKYTIKLNRLPSGKIMRSDGQFGDAYDKDFYVTVSIFKDMTISNYVDIEIDPLETTVERQLFNPFFIELGFFRTIKKISSEEGDIKENKSVQGKAGKYGIKIIK